MDVTIKAWRSRVARVAGASVILLILISAAGCSSGSDAALEVRMTGRDYRWEVRHPGLDGRLDTADDLLDSKLLTVPEHTEVRVLLESHDYVYTVAVPAFGLNEIVVPDLDFELNLPPSAAGRFPLVGDHLCGYDHPELVGTLVVRVRDDYDSWMETR